MVRHVAVIHEGVGVAGEIFKFGDERDPPTARQVSGVFPALFKLGHGTVAAGNDFKLHVVHVEGVTKNIIIGDLIMINEEFVLRPAVVRKF